MVYLRLENIVCSSIYSISLLSSRFKLLLTTLDYWMNVFYWAVIAYNSETLSKLIDWFGWWIWTWRLYSAGGFFFFNMQTKTWSCQSTGLFLRFEYHKLRHRVSLPPLIGRLTTQRMNEWMRMLMCVCVSSSWVGYLIFKWFHWKIIKK